MPQHRRRGHNTARRLASATVVGAAVTGAVVSTTGTAAAADSPDSKRDIQRFQPGTGHGKPQQLVTFKGRFIENGKPLANQRVTLRASAPGKGWHVKRTVRTDEHGLAKASAKIHTTGQWRMVLAGNLDDDPKTELRVTPIRTVQVPEPKAKKVLQTAAKLAGTPYAYGGTTPAGFDCSGFTQYVYRKAGVHLPRTSDAQASAIKRVSHGAKKPGDLLFFHEGGNVYHAAIYAGRGKMWTAPQTGETVKLDGIYTSSYFVGRAW